MNVLYIKASSKEENISTSKLVGNMFIEKLKENTSITVESLDLYKDFIPLPKAKYFTSRASLVEGEYLEKLTDKEKKDIDRMDELCNSFLKADVIIIATPMWSISFPSVLKQYIDCICLNNKLIYIDENEVTGLLNDKKRAMVYIQSSGGDYPMLLSRITNHGLTYMKDLFNFLGITTFKQILVEGTEQKGIGKEKAIKKAEEKFDEVIEKILEIEKVWLKSHFILFL